MSVSLKKCITYGVAKQQCSQITIQKWLKENLLSQTRSPTDYTRDCSVSLKDVVELLYIKCLLKGWNIRPKKQIIERKHMKNVRYDWISELLLPLRHGGHTLCSFPLTFFHCFSYVSDYGVPFRSLNVPNVKRGGKCVGNCCSSDILTHGAEFCSDWILNWTIEQAD